MGFARDVGDEMAGRCRPLNVGRGLRRIGWRRRLLAVGRWSRGIGRRLLVGRRAGDKFG